MQAAWLSALAFLVVSTLVGVGMLAAARLAGVRARTESPLKRRTYECGEEPAAQAWMQFHARYYVVALLFVVFDVEAVFIFPWVVQLEAYGGFGLAEMAVFIFVLVFGLVYAWRKGVLRWV